VTDEEKVARPLEPAEIAKLEAETRKLEAEADAARTNARVAEITLETAERVREKTLAGNEYHHVLDFTQSVGPGSVGNAMSQLDIWRRVDPGCDIEIRFNSPGGEVLSGMAFFDYIRSLRDDGHRVICSAYGYAASMAGILLQAGTSRVMGREAYVLIHEVSGGAQGSVGEIDDTVEFMHTISDRVLDIFAARTKEAGENGTASSPLNRGQLKTRWTRKNWWLTSDEALKYGIVDEVR